MPSLVISFPHRRYHATPWGHHVNEGLVEYPPSPWRLVRALLATGYAKLGWSEPPLAAAELVHALASVLPVYRLPPATAAHTRHYMPIHEGKKVTTTKVIDAFARVGDGAPLGVTWPVVLSEEATALLAALAERLGYLGRAESVVSARLVGDSDLPIWPETRADLNNAPGLEAITLLAPIAAQDYEAWRTSAATAEREQRTATTGKGATKRASKTAGADTYPPTLLAALQCETNWLQRLGWSQPPGSRSVTYWRPRDVLDSSGPARSARRGVVPPADTALLVLASDTSRGEVLPPFGRALPQAELLHRSLISLLGDPPPDCPELAGRSIDGSPLQGHKHAHFIPLDRDGDRRLDHVLVHAPMGLGADAQTALRRLRRTWTQGGDKPLFVTLAGVGALGDFMRIGSKDVPELATAARWVSRTPFIPPRFVKAKKHSVDDQVRAELVSRGLPRALRVELSSTHEAWNAGFQRFVRARRAGAPQPPATAFFHLRIDLESPISGPLMLGYGSHFGLGLFVPDDHGSARATPGRD